MNQARNKAWTRTSLKDPHRQQDKRGRVQEMFSAIAGTYDLLNHLLSLNLDRRWRRQAVKLAQVRPGHRVLDLCCGTGDLAFTFAEIYPELEVVAGIDFSESMLRMAQKKTPIYSVGGNIDRCNMMDIKWLCSDAECLPFADGQFDCVSFAFGIRNLQHLLAGLQESLRVLKPNGRLVILEFTLPKNRLLAGLYGGYFRLVIPLIGSIISKDTKGAYHYLPESVRSFRTTEELIETIKDAGFEAVQVAKLSGGIVAAYTARKP
jgi:demethylmenaquinone methyltransferase / 2-methoxy-6-polyprenyl-1,4-benzoquinol methylase